MPREKGTSPDWGGKRKGAGSKPVNKVFSDKVKKDFLRAAARKAKETGISLGELVVNEIYNMGNQDAVRAAWFKAWASVVVVRETASSSVKEIHKVEHGVVELPTRHPDPAVEVPPPLN